MSSNAGPAAALFTAAERLRLEVIAQHHRSAAAQAPGLALVALLTLAAAAGVVVLEWEIIFRVFDYLAGSEDAYWSPRLMACSAAVVIAGFHLLARAQPAHPLVRLVDRAVGVLIPVYLVGVGLLLAAILYADGLGNIAAEDSSAFFPGLLETPASAASGQWLDSLFAQAASPLAVLIFAVGIGGIAICNLFVAHRLLVIGTGHLREVGRRVRRARQVKEDLARVVQAQRRYAELVHEIDALDRTWDEAGIREAITRQVLSVIAESLMPHKAWLARRALHKPERFEQDDAIAADRVAAHIERIEAITRDDVMAALQS